MSEEQRDQVFICYSHADANVMERVRLHLKSLSRDTGVPAWCDRDIPIGTRWRDAITTALARAKVAILLVSADFLASSFIHDVELPALLAAAREDGALIIPIYVSYCDYANSEIGEFQSPHSPTDVLAGLSPSDQDRVLTRLATELRGYFDQSSIS